MDTSKRVLLIVIVLIAGIYVTGKCSDKNRRAEAVKETSWQSSDNSRDAFYMMQEFVKRNLKSPSTADFPSYYSNEHMVHKSGDKIYTVRSYVDSQNAFGAMLRTSFIGEIKQTGKEKWMLVSLNFTK